MARTAALESIVDATRSYEGWVARLVPVVSADAASTLRLSAGAACAAILNGYRAGVRSGGRPFVLAEEHPVLRGEAESELRNPVAFWRQMLGLPILRYPPEEALSLLRAAVSEAGRPRYVARRAGLGSLGHPRVVAIAELAGGHITREAKALVGSGAGWAANPKAAPKVRYRALVDAAVRSADPLLMERLTLADHAA